MSKIPYDEKYDAVEEAHRIAEEHAEYYIARNELTDEEWQRLNNLFESKDKTNKDLRMFNIKLAELFGLNEAIFLHQLRGSLKYDKRSREIHDHRGRWVGFYNSYDSWLKIFPMFSRMTLRRTINRLEKAEILISKRGPWQKYYGINFRAIL